MTDLDDYQRLFLTYLSGSAPSLEDMSRWMEYMKEVDKVNNTDYCGKENISVLKMRAALKGLSLEEFKGLLNLKRRKVEIDRLKKEYGYKIDKKEPVKAAEYIKSLLSNLGEDDLAHKQLQQFFNRPEGLKEKNGRP